MKLTLSLALCMMSSWVNAAVMIPLQSGDAVYTEHCNKILASDKDRLEQDKVLLQTAYKSADLSASQKRMVSKAATVLEQMQLSAVKTLDVEAYVRLHQTLSKLNKGEKPSADQKGLKELSRLSQGERIQQFVDFLNGPGSMDQARAEGAWALVLGISSDEKVKRGGVLYKAFTDQGPWAKGKYQQSSIIVKKSVCKELTREIEELKQSGNGDQDNTATLAGMNALLAQLKADAVTKAGKAEG